MKNYNEDLELETVEEDTDNDRGETKTKIILGVLGTIGTIAIGYGVKKVRKILAKSKEEKEDMKKKIDDMSEINDIYEDISTCRYNITKKEITIKELMKEHGPSDKIEELQRIVFKEENKLKDLNERLKKLQEDKLERMLNKDINEKFNKGLVEDMKIKLGR